MELENKALLEVLDEYMDKKPSMVVENTIENFGSYKIEVYLASDPTDKMFISGNRKLIQDFLDKGYVRAGIGHFFGCANSNAVKKNTTMLKVAKKCDTDEIIAMSIYSSRLGGFKCVGATITTDDTLRGLGYTALMQLVREDAKLWNKFVWAECSGKMDIMWEQAGAIKIPNAYLPLFMDEKLLETVEIEDDEIYEYSRVFNRGTLEETRVTKTIYGFPNKDVLMKYIEDVDMTLEELCAKYGKDVSDILLENVHYRVAPKEIWPDLKVLMHFKEVFTHKGISQLTQYEMDVLVDCARTANKGLEKYWCHMNSKDEKALYSLILSSMIMANSCSIIKPYELGEMLIPEQRRFEAEEMYPSCLY